MSIKIGCHVNQDDPLGEAAERSAQIVQLFLGEPQGWKGPQVRYPSGAAGLKADAEAAGVGLYVHAPYVINLASTNNRVRIPSRKLLQQHVSMAAQIGACGVIVHGGHVGSDAELASGFDNWRKAIDGLTMDCPVFIENTAGGGHAMARFVESIGRLWDAIAQASGFEEVGFCLDTCHAHAAGENLSTLVDRIKAITGRIDLVHANDSRDAAGSGADRHANLGHGQADPDAIVALVRAGGCPAIVETPGPASAQKADIEWLRQRLGNQCDRVGNQSIQH